MFFELPTPASQLSSRERRASGADADAVASDVLALDVVHSARPMESSRHALRLVLCAASLLSALLICLPAARAQTPQVAVLPITTSTVALRIYRNAIPTALAAELSTRLGVMVRAVPSSSAVVKGTHMIVDGRLVARKGDTVQLDVQVRRASTGQRIATISSAVTQVTDIDRLVGEIANSLVPVLGHVNTGPILLPTTVVRGAPSAADTTALVAFPVDVLLLPAEGQAAKGMVEVREPATAAAVHMLARYGISAGKSTRFEGVANAVEVVAEMRLHGITHSMMVEVVSVEFAYASVLAAKGRVRVVLIGADGLAVLDRTVSTDTVVGGRGERHQALVYRVAEQALDILAPRIRRGLAGKGAKGA